MSEERLQIFTKGCLGTCWCGKYHYLEPWAGCAHDCHYCYARWRSPVMNSLADLKTEYLRPVPLLDRDALLRGIREGVAKEQVRIAKLCRYTDILNPAFVKDGLAADVLAELCKAGVERIIITTKGVPDERILRLMADDRDRFSYNAAVRPDASLPLEPGAAPRRQRLEAASRARASGVKTTIHFDPIVAGFDDEPSVLVPFLEELKALGLDRVMFSYLLLFGPMIARLREKLPAKDVERLLGVYDLSKEKQYLPHQEETVYSGTKPEVRRRSVDAVSEQLSRLGFQFVLCGLKSAPGAENATPKGGTVCDGTFYA